MPSVLITGADKGLGLEFARQYADEDWRVFAACRHPERAESLQRLAADFPRLAIHALDVADHGQVDDLARQLGSERIDVLLNNAGIYGDEDRRGFGTLDYRAWEYTLRVNVLGPVKMAEAFLEHVARSERRLIVAITSKMGSIADNGSGGAYLYRSSKAALNAAYRSLALDLRPQGIGVLLLHPGWVQTDMGGRDAPLAPERSIRGMRDLIARFKRQDSGRFYAYDGREIPW